MGFETSFLRFEEKSYADNKAVPMGFETVNLVRAVSYVVDNKAVPMGFETFPGKIKFLSLIHISEPTRPY